MWWRTNSERPGYSPLQNTAHFVHFQGKTSLDESHSQNLCERCNKGGVALRALQGFQQLRTPPYPPRCSSLNLAVLLYALPAPTRTAAWSSWIVFLLLRKAVGWDGWRCIDRLALSSRHLSLVRYQSCLRESFRSQRINPLVRSPKCFLNKKGEVG